MSVSVWNKRINLWLQVKYSILCMNNVVLLCFLFINPSFCLQFCQSIPWHTLFTYICYNLHLLSGMKPVTSNSLKYIWRLCVILRIWCWSEHQNQSRWACQFLAWHAEHAKPTGFTIGMPGMQKTGNELSTRREIWELSLAGSILGCEGMNPFFPCLWDVISKYKCSLEFCHA